MKYGKPDKNKGYRNYICIFFPDNTKVYLVMNENNNTMFHTGNKKYLIENVCIYE